MTNTKVLSGKKIMWIEDDEFFSALMTKKLGETGCTLVFVPTGEKAIEIVQEEKPDLIILDILLPDMDGFKVLEKIRSVDVIKQIPVVILSNVGGQENIDRAFSFGVAKYFVKTSINFTDIVNEITALLSKNI